MEIKITKTLQEIESCYPVVVQLRTAYTKEKFLEQVKKQQVKGYLLAYGEENGKLLIVAGFRIVENLAHGRLLYVDDLITDENNRSEGYGDELFDWLIDFAKKENCGGVYLDSGVQRFEAHKFYFRKGMKISSYHFSIDHL